MSHDEARTWKAGLYDRIEPRFKDLIKEMRHIARDEMADGHNWSQTCGDGVDVEIVERWANELEKALDPWAK